MQTSFSLKLLHISMDFCINEERAALKSQLIKADIASGLHRSSKEGAVNSFPKHFSVLFVFDPRFNFFAFTF